MEWWPESGCNGWLCVAIGSLLIIDSGTNWWFRWCDTLWRPECITGDGLDADDDVVAEHRALAGSGPPLAWLSCSSLSEHRPGLDIVLQQGHRHVCKISSRIFCASFICHLFRVHKHIIALFWQSFQTRAKHVRQLTIKRWEIRWRMLMRAWEEGVFDDLDDLDNLLVVDLSATFRFNGQHLNGLPQEMRKRASKRCHWSSLLM